jgi:cell division protease FtsH
MDFSDFVKEVESNNVQNVTIKGMRVYGHLNNGLMFHSIVPYQDKDLVPRLINHNVKIKATMPEESSFISTLLSWLPMIFIIGMWIFYIRQMSKGSSRNMGFGKVKTKKPEKEKTTFKDVAGADEAKAELEEIVDFLKNPKKFQTLGGRMPKGVMLVGPPGTGKTLLARAVAGEASCHFYYVAASEFVEMFVGVGASRVRDLFERAKQNLPCIIFIDEIDAMGRHRGVGLGGGNDEREQTLNEFLVQLDGFNQNAGLVVFAATNRPDVLDNALTRSGRFDRQITVGMPSILQREAILGVHAKKVILKNPEDLKVIAKGTSGFSGADLENLINESALLGARKNKKALELEDLEAAKDKIIMGPEKRTLIMQPEEKRLTAYHEAGHAILAVFSEHSDPIHKATIVPRGMALGMVVQIPENDKVSMTKIQYIERLRISMGGRAAEEIEFGQDFITSGAASDIKAATNIAKKMVLEFGMSKKCGMMNYQDSNEIQFGRVSPVSHHSQEFARLLDEEIKELLDNAYDYAKNLLTEKKHLLVKLAEKLLEVETLSGDEIKALIKEDSEGSNKEA